MAKIKPSSLTYAVRRDPFGKSLKKISIRRSRGMLPGSMAANRSFRAGNWNNPASCFQNQRHRLRTASIVWPRHLNRDCGFQSGTVHNPNLPHIFQSSRPHRPICNSNAEHRPSQYRRRVDPRPQFWNALWQRRGRGKGKGKSKKGKGEPFHLCTSG
jgi:hypothetical protein